VLQIKSIRSILLVCSYVCLSVFLVEKTVVPFLHQHHEEHSKVQGDSLQNATDCLACDLAKATLEAEQIVVLSFVFVVACLGVLQLFIVVQQTSGVVIFSSLRGPPVSLSI
jgi:hypothetical protein